jgi:hypothetical protein
MRNYGLKKNSDPYVFHLPQSQAAERVSVAKGDSNAEADLMMPLVMPF